MPTPLPSANVLLLLPPITGSSVCRHVLDPSNFTSVTASAETWTSGSETRSTNGAEGAAAAEAEAEILLTSRWTLPSTPSAQISTRFTPRSSEAERHVDGSSEQVAVGSPVAELHLSVKLLKGTWTVVNVSPGGTVNLPLKQPREKGMPPPPAQEYSPVPTPE